MYSFGYFKKLRFDKIMSICAHLGIKAKKLEGGRDHYLTKKEKEQIEDYCREHNLQTR